MKKRSRKKIYEKRIMAFLVSMSLFVSMPVGQYRVRASEISEDLTSTEAAATESGSEDTGDILGKNMDVTLEVSKSITGKIGKKVKVAFKVKSSDKANIKLKNVYPVIDSNFPFETSGDAYKVVKAGSDTGKQAALSASFSMTSRSDITEGYHSVNFICEYTKADADGNVKDYYVVKSINISFADPNESKASDDDDDDDDTPSTSRYDSDDDETEVTAPKLILTGYETDPEKIMAGETFTLTIHIQNTSKTTPVCNAKFLIGNEAGSFLPTSGSSAVFVDRIPADSTGDVTIELKTAADLAQKTYILVVKGDFDDGKGNNFTSSDNLSVPVYQEVKLGVSDVTMSPEALGIGSEGSLMFTINNQGSAGVYNVNVSVEDDAVTGETSYVGNIAASSSAYATLNLTGVQDNSDTGKIKVIISYEDSEGNAGKIEQMMACSVGEDVMYDDFGDGDYDDEYDEDDEYGLPWQVIVAIVLLVAAVIAIVVILLIKKKKKRAEELLMDEDGEDDLDNEDF